MKTPVIIENGREKQRLEAGDFPLALGGREAGIELLGVHAAEPVAWLGMEQGELFLQSAGGDQQVLCSGTPVSASQWLHDGDLVRIGDTSIAVSIDADAISLRVEHAVADTLTEAPLSGASHAVEPTPPEAGVGAEEEDSARAAGKAIQPAAFTPGSGESPAGTRRRLRPVVILTWVLLSALVPLAWFLFTMRSVEFTIEPPPDRFSIEGGIAWKVAGRHLMRPGVYRLLAEKAGYSRLDTSVAISEESDQSFRFSLKMLPGLLSIDAGGVEGAQVRIDDEIVGRTPLDPVEVAAGTHQVRIEAERYRAFSAQVEIEGKGVAQTLKARLLPLWAAITFQSKPAGARVRVDGREVGRTPVAAELLAGRHTYELDLSAHKPFRGTLEVEADQAQTLAPVELLASDGRLVLQSRPPGAAVTVDGDYGGQTPVELVLSPDLSHEIALSLPGYEPASRKIRLESDQRKVLELELSPRMGEVLIAAVPPDAQLFVNGKARGPANQKLNLIALPQQIEIRKKGYQSYRGTLTPRPGLAQSLRVRLKTLEEIQAEKTPPRIQTSQGQELVLIRGGRFQMGAPRREPGRRSNETRREVELKRPFYFGTMEVSNEQFRVFKKEHLSGGVGTANLEIDHHPVVEVTWEEAALYCNWLSRREALPPAFKTVGSQVVAVRPPTTGYRLPTEAEWAWVARYAGRRQPVKYPWGDALPMPLQSGNYAGISSREILRNLLPNYVDGFPATAPVNSFAPNPAGVYNLGGNVAEWCYDIYTIYSSRTNTVERDPTGKQEGDLHAIRGSSWMDATITKLRLSYRDYGLKARPDLGFRLARYAE